MSNTVVALRPICDIAAEILPQISGNTRFYAEPYLLALLSCRSINDTYFADDARTLVLYTLSNLTSWRGEQARALKAELKSHLN